MKGTRTYCRQCDHPADLVYADGGPICDDCFAQLLREQLGDGRTLSCSELIWLHRYDYDWLTRTKRLETQP